MKTGEALKGNRTLLLWLVITYLAVIALYGGVRVLAGNQKVTAQVEFADRAGHRYEEVSYFSRVRVLRSIEVLNFRDFATASYLFLTGICCFLTYCLLRQIPARDTKRGLYLLLSVAFFYLGLDELIDIHYTIALNLSSALNPGESLQNIAKQDPGAVIIAAYAVFAAGFIAVEFRFLSKNRLAFLVILVGFLLQALAAVADFFYTKQNATAAFIGPIRFLLSRDEIYELTASFLYLASFMLYSRSSLRERFRLTQHFDVN
jgi:hypothetical protein